jgi:hypothetical protein
MQTQGALTGTQIEMVVHTRWGQVATKGHTTGHAQMHHQKALIQIQQKVLAAPTNTYHRVPHQLLRQTAQGPAQRLPHANRLNLRTGDAIDKTQPGDFNFR